MSTEPKLLTSADVIRILNISERTYYRLKKEGKIVPVLTDPVRYHLEDILRTQQELNPGHHEKLVTASEVIEALQLPQSMQHSPVPLPPFKAKRSELRFLCVAWAAIFFICLILDMHHWITNGGLATIKRPGQRVLSIVIEMMLTLRLAVLSRRSPKVSVPTLITIGQIVRYSWALSLLIIIISMFTPLLELTVTNIWYMALIAFASSGFGAYTYNVANSFRKSSDKTSGMQEEDLTGAI